MGYGCACAGVIEMRGSEPAGRVPTSRRAGTGNVKGAHPAKAGRPLQRQNLGLPAFFQPVSSCVELRSILPFSAGVAFVVPLSLANYIVILRTAIDALSAVLFPAPCRICGTMLLNASRIPICDSCLASLQPIQQPMCACCRRPFPAALAAAAATVTMLSIARAAMGFTTKRCTTPCCC